ncbi:6803_t:CDS:2 [Ambispora gerdemannii]|uniref:6803_t:CDS:1 n=1 Tax=Ambispora gerdemannii TaxID=144530 RepID=A0A9N9DKI8_9GLOM|nr:6803_t:CDS:2 [Ambispora gerdemannii]
MSFTLSDTQTQREKRENCWRLRDAYFTCLDFVEASIANNRGDDNSSITNNRGSENVKNSNGNKKINIIDSRECTQKKKEYEEACPSSWIIYFHKRRELEKRQRIRAIVAKELGDEIGVGAAKSAGSQNVNN